MALQAATQVLAPTSDTARLDAELLMAHALGVPRMRLLLHHLADPAPPAFAALLARRSAHEPVAYILGCQEFWGLPLQVTPATLIPRADSETIVAAALAACPAPARVLDCGTGSGALLLAVLSERPVAQGLGVDASSAALAVAQANAAALGLAGRAHFQLADWTRPDWTQHFPPATQAPFDLVLANPPYVETTSDLAPSVRDYEPASALFSGPEGLDDYRCLIPQLPALLAGHGVAVLEIGHTQAACVGEIAEKAGFCVTISQDLAGRDRALVLRFGAAAG